eukprot:13683661-Alexandrium_andersonii.AAC.1
MARTPRKSSRSGTRPAQGTPQHSCRCDGCLGACSCNVLKPQTCVRRVAPRKPRCFAECVAGPGVWVKRPALFLWNWRG